MSESRTVKRFLQYVTTSSESGHERTFSLLLEEELKRLGFTVTRDECGAAVDSDGFNVHGFLTGKTDAEPLLFCCHQDTVPPGTDIHPQIRDGVIYSDGTTVLGGDDKAGIAAVLEGVERLVEQNALARSVEVLFTLREETGLQGSRNADYSVVRSRQAVVFDCGGPIGTVITRSPEIIDLEVTYLGKAAHAATPEKGIHALKAAAQAVADIDVGRVDEISTVNIGNFLAPGKTNVICPKTTFGLEVRSFDKAHCEQLRDQIVARLHAAADKFGASCEVLQTGNCRVVSVGTDSPLMKLTQRAFEAMGLPMIAESTFGGCDASNLSAHGIAALNVSCGMEQVHSTEEYLRIDDLEKAADFVQTILSM